MDNLNFVRQMEVLATHEAQNFVELGKVCRRCELR